MPSSSPVFVAIHLAGLAGDIGVGNKAGGAEEAVVSGAGEPVVERADARGVVLCNNWNAP